MKHVIFVNNRKKLQKVIAGVSLPSVSVLQITYDAASKDILDYLGVTYPEIHSIEGKKYIQGFEKIYAEFIGELNIKHAGLMWWTYDFTNKNPITTKLCNCVFYALLVNAILKEDAVEHLVVICDDVDICHQVQENCADRDDVKVINCITGVNVKKIIKEILPVAAIYKMLVVIKGKLLAHFYLPKFGKRLDKHIVIMSLLYNPSFKGESYQDVYFGEFPEFLKKKGRAFINFMEVCAPYSDMMRKTRNFAAGCHIYPKEYFLSFKHIFKGFVKALAGFIKREKIKGCPLVKDVDVSLLVNRFMRYEYTSTHCLANLLTYYAVKDVCAAVDVEVFYYPFENRSFEKMMVMALRKFSSATKVVGYQHASFSLRHTNFLLGPQEHKSIPLPDRILTLGEASKDFLEQEGNFPKGLLHSGCALRQKPYEGRLNKRRQKQDTTRILVALATDLDEYVKTLHFLDAAVKDQDPFEIWIRPHPVYSLEKAIAIAGQPSFRFYKADQESLAESYAWADVLVYVHSMVSAEGLMHGVPLVRIDVENPLNPDPLMDFQDFKWEAFEPSQFSTTIEQISRLPDEEYAERQKKGRVFAERFMRKTTDEELEKFLSCGLSKN